MFNDGLDIDSPSDDDGEEEDEEKLGPFDDLNHFLVVYMLSKIFFCIWRRISI